MTALHRSLWFTLALALAPAFADAQELPPSGIFGIDLVYGTNGASSQLYAFAPTIAGTAIPIGPAIGTVPSRWAHRRRNMQGLETSIAYAAPATLLTPMGNGVGNGSIHMIDGRVGLTSNLVVTGNPAAYDLLVVDSLEYVFVAEDNGAGGTTLRGYSWATPNLLTPLTPPTLTIAGSPASYVNRIGFDSALNNLYVPTATGIGIVSIAASAPQMTLNTTVSSAPRAPSTNPTSFVGPSGRIWVIGTVGYSGATPNSSGWLSWDSTGASNSADFGTVPSNPAKKWVPAVGTEELAVVSDGTDAFVYYLLREPGPGTFFVKGSAVGAIHFNAGPPSTGTIPVTDQAGEPFSIPTVSGARVAFETSFGQPFVALPPDGGERVCILYSPIDALGAPTPFGLIGVPAPLGGRISTKGMDRPLWSRDGTRVISFTSHFPGAPNPLEPGIESLYVPALVAVNEFTSPHAVVPNPTFPYQSIIYPSVFNPRDPSFANMFGNLTFVGNVFENGMAGAMVSPFGELGQMQTAPVNLVQNPAIPGFPSILPAAFQDATGSLVAIPADFGARRTSFNVVVASGLNGLTMIAAVDHRVLIQPTGVNTIAALGLTPQLPPYTFTLPLGTTTTSEFLSL